MQKAEPRALAVLLTYISAQRLNKGEPLPSERDAQAASAAMRRHLVQVQTILSMGRAFVSTTRLHFH